MNEDKIKGQWKQLHGKLKTRWGKLTDDDLQVADGNMEYLVGKLQERYGMARDAAKKQVQEFGEDLTRT
ncbi:MAG TPA: CsbD family protein [Rhodanobacteraceae bacterium]|nr:CsbD family protein [Rhodanobacteraceae bacterium]